jgi:hypothetical protein
MALGSLRRRGLVAIGDGGLLIQTRSTGCAARVEALSLGARSAGGLTEELLIHRETERLVSSL